MMNHFREFCIAKETPMLKCPAEARKKMDEVDVQMIWKKHEEIWASCDGNNDGCLTEAEWLEYIKAMHDLTWELYGWGCDYNEELMRKGYHVITSFTPNENGINREALEPYMLCMKKIRQEL